MSGPISECPRLIAERLREAAAEIRACDGVGAGDILDPAASGLGVWSIEIMFASPLPPAVQERTAAHDLAISKASPHGDDYWVLVTA